MMKHDELIAKINEPDHWFKPFLDIRDALRQVALLHNNYYGMCMECELTDYPCPTIEAIEKELNNG